MRFERNSAAFLLLCVLACGVAAAQQERQNPDAALPPPAAKVAKHAKTFLIGPDDGMALISAALDARTRLSARADCSHLVHDIYERAGFGYDYASSSDLYAGADEFRRVAHPQPGDLVAWPGHVGIVVNPAQRSFYSALSTGLGIDAYDSAYWKERGHARFFRYVRTRATLERASNKPLVK
jgi:cell wall-associated NlpC family hydrolase